MKNKKSFILWILCIIYCLSPVDLLPGPIDDLIVLIATKGFTKFLC